MVSMMVFVFPVPGGCGGGDLVCFKTLKACTGERTPWMRLMASPIIVATALIWEAFNDKGGSPSTRTGLGRIYLFAQLMILMSSLKTPLESLEALLPWSRVS